MAGTDVTKSTSTTSDDKGVRPEVKIGAEFPKSDGSEGSSGNSWALSYTPGTKVLEMQVQLAAGGIMPSAGGLEMEIDEDGVNDMISWLAGVKNLISQAASANSNSGS